MTQEELKKILELHNKWLKNETGGKKADLSYADLRSANLSYANLRSADLSCADLRSANLRSANLRSANLRSADLSCADLRSADLSCADLRSANLRSANLSSANLRYADLSSANLRYANLRSADLSSAKNIYWLKRLLVSRKRVLNYLGFEVKKDYFYAYKSFGDNYSVPKRWKIKQKSLISEQINRDIFVECGSGINVGTLKWCKSFCSGKIWKVKVFFSAETCIPIYTEGKIRVSECQLIKLIK